MLSWQQAAALAAGLGVAGVLLVRAGHTAEASPGATWPRRWAAHIGPFAREAGVVVALYALWQLAGNLAAGGYASAISHAGWVWHAERAVHLPSELSVQHLILPYPLLSRIANLYYATMHFGLLIAMLVWLFARHRDGYPAVRNAMAATTAICLLISFIPVAPPRLLPSTGLVDLAARYGESVYGGGGPGAGAGADQLSAMPSVHVAWSLLVAWAVISRGTSRWRWLIVAHPVITVFVVVATGNHYWADGIVSATIVTVVLGVQYAGRAALRAARQRRDGAPHVTPGRASAGARGNS